MKRSFTKLIAALVLLVALAIPLGMWGAEGDVHDMGITQSTGLNNNASIPTINIAAQSYPVKTVTINWRYNKTIQNPVTIEVFVAGESWGTQTITGNTTADAVFEGTSTIGAIEINFTNNTGDGTGHGTFYVNSVKLTEGASSGPAPIYTVTLGDDNTELTQASAGASVTLPERDDVDPYSFEGWSETDVEDETTTAPTIIPAGAYTPTSDITLYPVYTRTETGSGTTNKTASTTIASYAVANNWESGQRYTSITLDGNITATGKSNGNNSKYYSTSPGTWRHYAGDSGEITITAASGTLSSVTFTYSGNTLTNGGNNVTSGNAYEVSGSSAVFAVSGTSSNTQVSAISVSYTITGGITTYYWSWPVVSTDPVINASNPDALAYNAAGGEFGYSITNPTSATLNAVSNADWITNVAVDGTNSKVTFSTSTNTAFTQRTGTITLSYTEATDKVITITQNAAPAPSISAEDVDIAGNATNGSIAYTISNPVSGGTLTASTVATWLTPGEVTSSTVPFTCEANQGAARSATVVLTYTYNTNQTVTKNVTVTQAKAPYTTIPALFAAATSTNKTVDVTFNNWVVSGVSSNGKNVFVTDNQGNGFVIYSSSDQSSTYAEGKILSGTATSCTLKLNNGYAQLTNVSGLTINTGGTVSVVNIALADLSGVHTGALVSYTNLTSSIDDSGQTTKYYLSDGNTTIQIYGSLYDFGSISASKTYDITGIYQQYSNTKEVLPRSANDIVLKAQMTAPTFNAFTYVVGGTSNAQTAAIAGTDFSGNLTVTVAEGEYVISNDGSNYGTSATFTQSSGTIASQILYVKLNSGLSAGTYNGKLSFTADHLDSFDVNLTGSVTANPTYNVVLTQPTGGIATIATDPAYAQSGTTITLSYSDVDDCYEFSSWSVMWEDTEMHEIIPNANNQFEMPAAVVYVSAIFTQKKFTVDYSVNGLVRDALQDEVNCGEEAYLWDEDEMSDEGVTMPTGYSFLGWTTNPAYTTVLASYEPEEDNTTLYAVLVPTGSTSDYVKVTANLGSNWAGDYLIAYSANYFADGRVGGTGTGGIGKQYVKVDLSESISSDNSISSEIGDVYCVTLEEISSGSNTYVLKTKDGQYNYYTSNDSNGLSSTTNKSTAANYPITVTFTSENDIRLCLGGDATGSVFRYNTDEYFRFYKNCSQSPVYLYKRTVPVAYTRVENITSTTATLPSIEPTYLITVESGGVLTLTGPNNGDETNLIVKDGGQLITHNAVQATVKKTIEEANNWGAQNPEHPYTPDGWYFIASPVNGAAFPTGTINDQDIYQLDWDNNKWLNLQNSNNSSLLTGGFQRGTGYLYASKDGNTISVAGEIQPLSNDNNATVTLANDGWNLIGNPLTCKVTVSTAFSALNNGSSVDNMNANSTINPCQGIAVYGNANDVVTFTKAATQNAAAPSNNSSLQMTLSQNIVTRGNTTSTTVDNAVVSFNEGSVLPKFSMLEGNAKLYIPQGTEEYAIVSSNGQGEMPVNFKANEDGEYTINVNPENVEMNYLHLIDNITGADVDLLATPSYTFNAKTTDYASRFRLVFSANNENENENENFAFVSNGQIILTEDACDASLQVIDMTGRVVSTQQINGSQAVSIDATAGVYVLRLINGSDIKTQKIVVK